MTSPDGIRVAESAEIDDRVTVGRGTSIWQHVHVRSDAVIGEDCIIGRGAYIGAGVQVGARSKIQNYALVYEPALIEEGVFIGPAVVLTNDLHPRAINPDGTAKSAHDWDAVGVTVRKGASVGARAVCIAPVTIGEWATVAAGAVVTKDVPDFALVAGVPARRVGWVGRAGVPLVSVGEGTYECPSTGEIFEETDGLLHLVDGPKRGAE